MGALIPFPKDSEVFVDVRGEDRTMRVTRHDESGVVVVSLWLGKFCRSSFRLPMDELPRLAALLGRPPDVGPVTGDVMAVEPPASAAGSAEFVA